MDLNTVTEVVRPHGREALPAWQPGDAFVAGGTWMFSEPQVGVRRLVDLTSLGWAPLAWSAAGLDVAATCTLAELEAFEAPEAWRAAKVIGQCCRALLGSFKIRRVATVGGNLCLALAASPMAALAVALHGVCTVWEAEVGERLVPALELITGAGETCLSPGEILRGVLLDGDVLRRRAAVRQVSLTPLGRSAALLIGTRAGGVVELTITGSVPRPLRLSVPEGSREAEVFAAVDAAVPWWYDDIHGRPAWRARMTRLMAAEIVRELRS